MTLNYNPLGEQGFRDLCHALLLEVLGPTYRPYSAGGGDGQRDGTFEGTPLQNGLPSGYWVVQFKHHDVETVGGTTARNRFLEEVEDELRGWRTNPGRKPDVLLFVTNVLATGVAGRGTYDRFDELVGTIGTPARGGEVLLWDKARLDRELDPKPHIRIARGGAVTLSDLFVMLTVASREIASPMSTQECGDALHVSIAACFARDWSAVVLGGYVANPGPRKLTLVRVELLIDGFHSLHPAELLDGKEVIGAAWQGPGNTEPIPPDEVRRWAWFLPVSDPTLRERLDTEQIAATVVMELYPTGREVLSLIVQPPPTRETLSPGQQEE